MLITWTKLTPSNVWFCSTVWGLFSTYKNAHPSHWSYDRPDYYERSQPSNSNSTFVRLFFLSVKEISYRKIKSINMNAFKDDLRQSDLVLAPPQTIDDFVSCYNFTCSSLLDKHASLLKKGDHRAPPCSVVQ